MKKKYVKLYLPDFGTSLIYSLESCGALCGYLSGLSEGARFTVQYESEGELMVSLEGSTFSHKGDFGDFGDNFDDVEPKVIYECEIVEMTDNEINSLPEFEG